MTETIAIFGGSFDPPHVGHVMAAAYVLSVAPVDRVVVVPTQQHPLDKTAYAPFEARMAMSKLAFADLTRAEVSDVERELSSPSYTLHTVQALQQQWPHARFRLVVGADILAETDRWFRFEALTELAPLFVLARAGFPSPEAMAPWVLPDIRSSELRDRLSAGDSVMGWVPRRVEHYIDQHRLYRETAS